MILRLLSLMFLASNAFAQLGTVTDLQHQHAPCPPGFTCNDYRVSTAYTPDIFGYAAIREPNMPVVATDVFFAGSGGQGLWQRYPITTPLVQAFWDDLSNSGHRIIQLAWASTWSVPASIRLGSDRAATVVAFFQNRYGGDFNLLGESWGAGEVADVIADWPVVVHRALIVSGPVEMNIAEGCETTNPNDPYYYIPSTTGGVDIFMGFQPPPSGPCYNRDVRYDQLWHENSVEFGGVYSYPNTRVLIYVGQNDSRDIRNRGSFYSNLLQQSGQSDLYFEIVSGCSHDSITCPNFLTALKEGLLAP